jgi:hypothetical protein
MATTTNTIPHETWSSFYLAKSRESTGPIRILDEKPFSVFDNLTNSLVNDASKLQLHIAGSALNFFMLPGAARTVRLIHHAFTMAPYPDARPLFIGLSGNRKGTAVFKEIPPRAAVLPMSAPAPPITRAASATASVDPQMLPSLKQLMGTKTKEEFSQLVGESERPITELEKWPNLFILHPSMFISLNGEKEILASTAGSRIIRMLREIDEDSRQESDDEDNEDLYDPDQAVKQSYRFLVFLWAVANGLGKPVLFSDPPDTDLIDTKQAEILAELYADPNPTAAGTTTTADHTGAPPDSSALTAALISNLNAVSRAQLDSLKKEERKKSMLSRLSPEAEQLFTLLSAKDWTDSSPQLNTFSEKLLADKDPTKALNIVHSVTRNWKGRVCEKGLIQFFSSGYMATDIHLKPSGFTIFMFHPDKTSSGRSNKTAQQAILSMFGETKIDDESVRYYASQDFYLASNPAEFEGQLETCILFLDLITQKDGIASEGYRFLLKFFKEEFQTFTTLFAGDPQFGIRIGYLADRVFQRFLNKLVAYQDVPSPITSAATRLDGRQRDYFDDALRGLEIGIMPNIPLPDSLSKKHKTITNDTVSSHVTETSTGNGTPKKSPAKAAGLPDVNKGAFKEWCLPAGKSHAEFFNPSKMSLRPNTQNWPQFPHHSSKVLTPMCVKFQTTGKCKVNCFYSHVDAMKDMDRPTRDTITARMQKIFKS